MINRIGERFGYASCARPSGELIWIHAASVGESTAALALIESMNKLYTKYHFLITSTTVSSADILNQKIPSNTVHQFIPFDNIIFIKMFLHHWRPTLGIIIESEFWPCLISQCAKICPILWINARISDKSIQRWRYLRQFFIDTIENFSEIISQSELDLTKFKALGVQNIKNLGNIKFANKQLDCDHNLCTQLLGSLKNKRIIVAASTHYEDEQIVLDAIVKLKVHFSDLYFIVIPRHPERKNELITFCAHRNLTYSIESIVHHPQLDKDLYIVDSFGKLGVFYNIADIVFVGGTGVGGHNILEPACFSKLIIFGPDMSNFMGIAREILAADAAIQIQNAESLFSKLLYFLSPGNIHEVQTYRTNALTFVQSQQQILTEYMAVIGRYLG